MCSKQLREAPKLKTLWRVTGARFSRQHRHDPLPHVFSLVFSIVGMVHLSSVLSLPLALYHSLLLVFGCKCTFPSIHVQCLAGVPPTNHAEMLDSLVRVPKRDERDHVARNKGEEANNRERTVASITWRSNAFHSYFP